MMNNKSHACPESLRGMTMADPAINECPYDYYAAMHRDAPVHYDERMGLWLVTRYADIAAASSNWDVFSSHIDMRREVSTVDPQAADELFRREGWLVADVLSQVDPPRHTVFRKMVERLFTGPVVKRMHTYLDEHVLELLAGFERRGRADFLSEFALLLPLDVIADQLGLPRSDGALLRRWSDAFIGSFDPTISADQKLAFVRIILEFQRYFVAWRQKKTEQPGDDLLSMLVAARQEDGTSLNTEDYLALCAQLMVAGSETTRNHLLSIMLMLCDDPALQARLRTQPDLIPKFVDESLRLESPAQGLYRRCTRDFELGGVLIPAGAIVMMMYGAGNRDPKMFAEPARLDLDRANANRHMAFGYGIHSCIGRTLATAELNIATRRLLERLGPIRLAPDQPRPLHMFHFNMRALAGLHIEFDVVAGAAA
jgi:cytochrome P450